MSERTRQEWEDATLDDAWAVEKFDEALDADEETIAIVDQVFYRSDILKKCDPIAYRCGFNDFTDYMAGEAPDGDEE